MSKFVSKENLEYIAQKIHDKYLAKTDANSFAETSDLENYLPLTAGSGKKLAGTLYANDNGIVVGKDSSTANNTKGIVFGENGLTKIGASSSLGLYSEKNIYLRPGMETDANAGIALTRTVLYPTTAKSISLGSSSNYFNSIYGTTIYQNGKQVANAEDVPKTYVKKIAEDTPFDDVINGAGVTCEPLNFTSVTNGTESTMAWLHFLYKEATQSYHGLMSKTDKTKLDNMNLTANQFAQEEYNKSLNMIVIPDMTIVDAGITFTIKDGTIHYKGTSTANVLITIKLSVPIVLNNETVSLNLFNDNISGANIVCVGLQDINLGWGSNLSYTYQNQTTAISEIILYVSNGSTVNGYVRPMLVKGSTKPTTYQKGYGEIVHKGDIEPVLLWENAQPTSSFSAQTITLKDNPVNYRFIRIYYKFNTNANRGLQAFDFIAKADNVVSMCCVEDGTTTMRWVICDYGGVNNTLQFFEGYYGSAVNNSKIIPAAIYGYKY